jgi:hypothetical protein
MGTPSDEILQRVKAIQDALGDSGRPPVIPLIDPTANVTALVLAEAKRQDQLREINDKHNVEIRSIEQHCATELDALREKLADAQLQRIDALALAEKTRIDAKISQGEQNVALTAERTTAQAAALATAMTASAEALRLSSAQQNDVTTKAIRILEQNQYQSGGRDVQRQETRLSTSALLPWIVAVGGVIAYLASHYKP